VQSIVDVAKEVVYLLEAGKQTLASVQYLSGEDVLFAVDPEVGKAFLGGIQDLSQVANFVLLVKNPIRFAEVLAVGAKRRFNLERINQVLELCKEVFAGPLPLFAIQIVLLI
jgi:hypothetical protein